MQKLAKITITLVLLAFFLNVMPLSVNAQSVSSGPSIRIGDPSCPAPRGIFSFEFFVSYNPEDQLCHYGPFSTRTEQPSFTSADTSLPGLQAIYFPTFLSVDQINSFSIWSWVAIIVTLIFVLMLIYWVILIVRAGLSVMHSGGDPAALGKAQTKITSVLMGVVFLVGFFVILNLVASFIGIGNFTEWPRVFSQCRDGQYFFTKRLSGQYANDAAVSRACFGS